MTERLNAATLERASFTVRQPSYDFGRLRPGIVHLGIGAFHRAHQAVFTEDAILAEGGDWGIVGVALRHPNVPDALGPQDGLYTVEILSAPPRYRVVGVVRRALAAKREPEQVLSALAARETHVISVTVTEKGYCLDAHGVLDLMHPDIAHDLSGPDWPRSAVGWLVRGLGERRRHGSGPVTVISCDNLLGNGRKLAAAVQLFANRTDGALARWIEQNATFPRTVVDCIVPATTDATRARIMSALGLTDEACVSREPFAQWVIEDRFAGPRPSWEAVGVELVADVEIHERLKLHVLNAYHSALAYLGLRRGHRLVREAIGDPVLARFVETMVAEEIAPALPDLPVIDYWRKVRLRFANPSIDHRLAQIAEDGSTKLAQRIFPLLIANARAGRPTRRLAAIVRAWLALAAAGSVTDPMGARLAKSTAGADPVAALDDAMLFPDPFRTEPALRASLLEEGD